MLGKEIIEKMELEQKFLSLYKESNDHLKEVLKMVIIHDYCANRIVQLRSNCDDAISQFIEAMKGCIIELEDLCIKFDGCILEAAKTAAAEELLKIETRTMVMAIFEEEVNVIENELY